MCGRYTLHTPLEIIEQIFQLLKNNVSVAPSYNIAPSQEIAIVLREAGGNRLKNCRWGFLPPRKSPARGHPMINARAETVAEKPGFQEAFRTQRCLVVADGFFEWRKEGKARKPMYVRLRSGEPFGFAGLYSSWTSPEGESLCTSTIITTDANDLLKPVHDRMPVIAPKTAHDLWLDPAAQDRERLLSVLRPFPPGELVLFDVSPRVNSPSNNSPENIVPLPLSAG